jgi:hypothetical protein
MVDYLSLRADERRDVCTTVGAQTGKSAQVLEKDVWVCWALDALFTTPGRVTMAFKGGTSLSKVYDAIARFSEDVDVTLDHRDLRPDLDPFDESLTSKGRKTQREQLEAAVEEHVSAVIYPHLVHQLSQVLPDGGGHLELSDNGENLRIYYPSALDATAADYVSSSVLLEFGGRNMVEPHETHTVIPSLAAHLSALTFPTATVTVLKAERTFWEKATLAHAECMKPQFRVSVDRWSRHWYDLYMLADQTIGRNALNDRALLADVVKYKHVAYYSASANYPACLSGGMRLIPDEGAVAALERDYLAMIESGMFDGDPPTWRAIVYRLRDLETEINERTHHGIGGLTPEARAKSPTS